MQHQQTGKWKRVKPWATSARGAECAQYCMCGRPFRKSQQLYLQQDVRYSAAGPLETEAEAGGDRQAELGDGRRGGGVFHVEEIFGGGEEFDAVAD